MTVKGGKRENSGRKAPTGGVRKNRSFKANDEEWAKLQTLAVDQGLNVSELIRTLLNR